jgi:hypothetical protein
MKNTMMPGPLAAGAVCLAGAMLALAGTPDARQSERHGIPAVLEPASPIRFPAPTDSNSPAFWLLFRGMLRLVVINSSPDPMISSGPDLDDLNTARPTFYRNETNGPRWIEAVLPDSAGRLYGYYHNEPAGVCGTTAKTAPRIGASRSFDGGRSWRDLGIVLQTAPVPPDCNTSNRYFAGGVGDFSAILDRDGNYVYFLYSSYAPARGQQGVAAARMRWSDRDDPQGRVAVWSDGVWLYPELVGDQWVYRAPSPILPAGTSWHDPRGRVDAFWGPSVHWNTFLDQYVMLLNRARDAEWSQEGIYITTSDTIDDPSSWLAPQKLLDGGEWYPQVMGLEPGMGTDKLAGQRARFFTRGESVHEIVFRSPAGKALPR